MITTFIFSAAAIGTMIAWRLLEMRHERMLGLSHASYYVEKRLRPYVKRLARKASEAEGRLQAKLSRSLERLKRHAENAEDVAGKYLIELRDQFRGKRSLQRGSVSFFLINITDTPGGASREKQALHDPSFTEIRETVESGTQ